ncbi:MAG: hypothetical protein Q4D22_00340 [Candidatus Saccharibacteria bacterium]|nr:hypothetical protein [Candidatus Saccharibacteria bacterium]
MHKFRKTMFIITIIFAVLTFVGLAMLIISSKELTDSLFDCVILLISAASIAIAIFSQLVADKESRRIEKLVREIGAINKTTEEDLKQDENLRRKLDKILYLEEEIYRRSGGRKDVKKVEKGDAKQ